MSAPSLKTQLNSKPHFLILDSLRGVAALMIICYHFFEGFATGPLDQKFNHGYLAVDFFFILSGFVMSYAYDDRWNKMKNKDFIKKRLIRLHPMVIMGTILGVITFCIQGCEKWDGSEVSILSVVVAALLTLFLIPSIPGSFTEIRGNGEMFPLNGPFWSLFFEYIGNILYMLFIRKLSTKKLSVLVTLAGAGLFAFSMFNLSGNNNIGVGWTFAGYSFIGGFLRLLFSYSAGMLIYRIYRSIHIKGAFWICSLSIVILLSMPFVGSNGNLWLNNLYDSVCIIVIFPVLLYIAASASVKGNISNKLCKFLGDISYPLYIVHYPFMYLLYSWVWKNSLTFSQTWPIIICMLIGNIVLAYLCLKLYDSPIRKWLGKTFLK